MTAEPLPPQQTHLDNRNIASWTDERLFGHRFHNEQTPWIVLLEFLAVFRSRLDQDRALQEPREAGAHEDVRYDIARFPHLRYLVFNNPHLQHIEQTVSGNGEQWRRWLKAVGDAPVEGGFGYLRERFETFSRFVRVVEFFQNTAVEPHRQRRWSSRFVFPYGPDCIYADADGKNGVGNPDRLFFARAGELLYLMLNRSGRGAELAEAISGKLMRRDDEWNRLATALQPDGVPPDRNPVQNVPVGYLPYAERSEYAELARDWLALLRADLPGPAVLDPLMRVTGLHLIRYLLQRASEEAGETRPPRLVLEIAAPRKTLLFDLSNETYDANRALPARAIEADLQRARQTEDWQAALQAREPALEAFRVLQQQYRWKRGEPPGGDPEQIFEALRKSAVDGHLQHVGKVVPEWSREIGLSTSRRGVGTWYAPDDAFLKALIMACVDEREEYHRFLSRLYERYRLVIGVAEAERAYGHLPTDERVFVENAARLEQRLRTLGLLQRLSDDCAYVTNPFKAAR
jgi:hypothetical protein